MNPDANSSHPYGTRSLSEDDAAPASSYQGSAPEPSPPPPGSTPPPYGTVASGGYSAARAGSQPPHGSVPPPYGPPRYGPPPPHYGPPPGYTPPGYVPPPPGYNPHSPGYQPRPLSEQEERNWGMIAHLSALAGMVVPFGHIIGPLVVLLTRGKESKWVERQARHALNFSITMTIASFVSFLLCFVLVGFVLLPLVIILRLVYTVLGAVAASNGQDYRYPLSFEFVK